MAQFYRNDDQYLGEKYTTEFSVCVKKLARPPFFAAEVPQFLSYLARNNKTMESKPQATTSPRSNMERREFCSQSLIMILKMTFEGKTRKEMNDVLIARFGALSFEKSRNPYKCRLLKFAFGVFRANNALKQLGQQHLVAGKLNAAFAADFKSVKWTEEEKTHIIEYGRMWAEHDKNKHGKVSKEDATTVKPRPRKRNFINDDEEYHQQQPRLLFFPSLQFRSFTAQHIQQQQPPRFTYFSSPPTHFFFPPALQDPKFNRN